VIVTVTLNPALDLTYRVDALVPHRTHRVGAVAERAGGKGVNVARVLHLLGSPVLATGLLGGAVGAQVGSLLASDGPAAAFLPIAGETRRTVAVADGRDATGFWEPGPVVTDTEWAAFAGHFRSLLGDAEVVVFSGSLPPGVPPDAYAVLIRLAARAGARTILDASGDALRQGLAAGPDLVKPNAMELAALLGGVTAPAAVPEARSASRSAAAAFDGGGAAVGSGVAFGRGGAAVGSGVAFGRGGAAVGSGVAFGGGAAVVGSGAGVGGAGSAPGSAAAVGAGGSGAAVGGGGSESALGGGGAAPGSAAAVLEEARAADAFAGAVPESAGSARLSADPTAGEPDARQDLIAAEAARAAGARAVVVSHGARGLVAATGRGAWHSRPPQALAGNPTGAGDACVAALARGLRCGTAWPDLLADAVALSAAAVAAPVAGTVDLDAYRRIRPDVIIEEL
jgi:1-phosphofructokinase family hexose kinase